VIDFLFAVIDFCSLPFVVETVKVKICQSRCFMWKETSPANRCCGQKTRVIAVSYGIKMLAVDSFISTLSMCVTDGRTDRQLDRITAVL